MSRIFSITVILEETFEPPNIAVTGFTVVDHLTILGIVISDNFETDEVNFRKLLGKIRGQSIFWSKFKLSTVGRINIAKTYLLSQISYFAPVLSLTLSQLKTLRTDIGTFIKGNLKISIDKVFDPIHAGGLGMIDVASFINSMKIVFYRKSFENNDFWAKEMQNYRLVHRLIFTIMLLVSFSAISQNETEEKVKSWTLNGYVKYMQTISFQELEIYS